MKNCIVTSEAYMVPLFQNGNEVFGDSWGTSSSRGTNRTHAWGLSSNASQTINSGIQGNIKLFNNTGSLVNGGGESCRLPDIEFAPPASIWTLGLLNPEGTAGVTIKTAYRCQPRNTTTCYDLAGSIPSSGSFNYIAFTQPKTIIRSVVIECSQTFTTTGSFNGITMNLNILSTTSVFLGSIISGVIIPTTLGQVVLDGSAIPSNIISDIWSGDNYLVVVFTYAGTITAGSVKIYVTTEVVTPYLQT